MQQTKLNPVNLLEMLHLQASINAKVNPDWLNAGYPWLRAAMLEAAEAMEHHGWKWWKAQTCDMPQLQMELVDIWHFALSHYLADNAGDSKAAAKRLTVVKQPADREFVTVINFDGELFSINQLNVLDKLQLLIGLTSMHDFSVDLFQALLTDCGMTWDDLYAQYVGKNVLNFFRQDNGYKEGTYIKIWGDVEDNVVLAECLKTISPDTPNFAAELYKALAAAYTAAVYKTTEPSAIA